jgi:hypothetical protein
MDMQNGCYHCNEPIIHKFTYNNLNKYYELENSSGFKPQKIYTKFNYLDNIEIKNKIILYKDNELISVRLLIPNIRCCSCIWFLENLEKLNDSILKSNVDFSKKNSYRKH